MIGYIYKLTILAGVKYNGNKPFYVGQHWGNIEDYWGSGKIWGDLISKLKKKCPKCWQKLIRKEILYSGNGYNQKSLDVLEAYCIKREKAHYSFRIGGCNILWGTANEFGSGSPMKNPEVAKRVAKSLKRLYREHPEIMERMQKKRQITLDTTDYKKRISDTLKGRYVGEKNPNYGNYWTDEQKIRQSAKMKGRYIGEKNPNYGNKWNEEQRKRQSKRLKGKMMGEKNPMYGKVRITNGTINTVINKDEPLPSGFWYGMKPRKK